MDLVLVTSFPVSVGEPQLGQERRRPTSVGPGRTIVDRQVAPIVIRRLIPDCFAVVERPELPEHFLAFSQDHFERPEWEKEYLPHTNGVTIVTLRLRGRPKEPSEVARLVRQFELLAIENGRDFPEIEQHIDGELVRSLWADLASKDSLASNGDGAGRAAVLDGYLDYALITTGPEDFGPTVERLNSLATNGEGTPLKVDVETERGRCHLFADFSVCVAVTDGDQLFLERFVDLAEHVNVGYNTIRSLGRSVYFDHVESTRRGGRGAGHYRIVTGQHQQKIETIRLVSYGLDPDVIGQWQEDHATLDALLRSWRTAEMVTVTETLLSTVSSAASWRLSEISARSSERTDRLLLVLALISGLGVALQVIEYVFTSAEPSSIVRLATATIFGIAVAALAVRRLVDRDHT